jgi:hypothetical protein
VTIELGLSCGDDDRTRAQSDGIVSPEGLSLACVGCSAEETSGTRRSS